jgi:MFS family permease
LASEGSSPEAGHESEAEAAYRVEVWKNLPRNYAGHLAHGLFGQTGFRLLNAPTFIPAYIFSISGSELAVGLARTLQALGMFLSPVLGATLIEHRKRVLPVGFVVGALMRLQVLGIALSGLFLPDSLALFAAWGFLLLFGFFMGMQGVIFNFLMSKVIPVQRRGVLMGLRNFLAGLTASAVAYAGGHYLVDSNALGNGYAATFLVAFALTAVGLSMLLLIREPVPPDRRAPSRLASRLRDLPALLRSDRPFTIYFSARALATMGRMAVPFYILFAGTRIEVSGAVLGQLSLAFLLAQTSTNLLWGWIADRTGFRLIFLLSLVLWMLSALVLMQSFEIWMLMGVFAGLGAGQGGFMMASQNLVLEFGAREDLPMRIAVANSASELVGAIGPLLGGLLAMFWSYELVFWVAIGFQAAAIGLVMRFVDEPRHRIARA